MTLSLFDQPDAIRQRWEEFHAEHPEIYRHLVLLARTRRRMGRPCGIKALWERLRWDVEIGELEKGPDGYRLNNNYTALYAREIMAREPDLRGFFETRQRKSA